MDHLVPAMAFKAAGADPTKVKYLPFDAGGKAMAALLSGEADALSTGFSEAVVMEKAGKVHIVGQHAFNYAQIFSTTELKRPMSQGLLNPKEKDALPVLNAIVGELLGKAKGKETCVYCIPAKPIDQTREVSYHEDVLKQIIETYGYDVKVIEESVALAYEGLVDNDLTGIAISMGAGMCNICVMYQGMSALSFSVARGGDWIDENVASDCGVTKAKVISVKENSSKLDLTKSAICLLYTSDAADE